MPESSILSAANTFCSWLMSLTCADPCLRLPRICVWASRRTDFSRLQSERPSEPSSGACPRLSLIILVGSHLFFFMFRCGTELLGRSFECLPFWLKKITYCQGHGTDIRLRLYSGFAKKGCFASFEAILWLTCSPFSGLQLLSWALEPPSDGILDELYLQGHADAGVWIRSRESPVEESKEVLLAKA